MNAAETPWAWPWSEAAWQRTIGALDTLHHGLLITGQPGIAKREFGLALAHALLCETPGANGANGAIGACGACHNCTLFAAATHPDFHVLTTEREWRDGRLKLVAAYCDRYQDIAARDKRANPSRVIPIDQVRHLIEQFHAHAHTAKRKVALLMPADRMNINAANALLKLLEEPPADSVLILVSATPGYLPATIRSRCFQIAIPPPHADTAREWLRGRLAEGGGGGGDGDGAAGGAGDGDAGDGAGDGDGDAGDGDAADSAASKTAAAKVAKVDFAAIDRALANAGPVDVLQMQRDGFLQRHAQLSGDFGRLVAGQAGALELAAQWAKHDFARVLDWMHHLSAALIKTACGLGAGDRGGGGGSDPGIDPRIDLMARPLSPAKLFKLYDQIGHYRKISREPLNEQLAMEELLLALREALSRRK
ncbi:MAG: hypothetical protein OXU62_13310 [Gammaproteobacteria bacterium]|nr:hypothetical protein [Gammaproteobacteria bacterium]